MPLNVVERADLISKKFAEQFREKQREKQSKQATSKLPLVAQADFAYLFKLASGEAKMPEDPARKKVVLKMLKETVRRHLKE